MVLLCWLPCDFHSLLYGVRSDVFIYAILSSCSAVFKKSVLISALYVLIALLHVATYSMCCTSVVLAQVPVGCCSVRGQAGFLGVQRPYR